MSRLALVGCGRHMRTTLVSYLRQLEDYIVETCIDLDETAARAVQQMVHANRWARSIDKIDRENIDAAIIALPPKAAYQVTSCLIKQEIACFVEKPPASTTDEMNDLMQLARENEVYVQIGFNFRFAEAMVAFHTCVRDYRAISCIANIEYRSKHPSGPEWELQDPVAAWMYHNGIHALDLLLWTMGEVHQVNAHITQTSDGKFTIVALFKHASNSVSTLKMGTLTDKLDLRVALSTSDAYEFYLPNLGEVVMQRQNGRVGGEVIYHTNNLDNGWSRTGYGPELQYFLDNYNKYEKSWPSLLDAMKASQLCDSIMNCLQSDRLYSHLKDD
jgi:predicted dehydrogenase